MFELFQCMRQSFERGGLHFEFTFGMHSNMPLSHYGPFPYGESNERQLFLEIANMHVI